MEPRPYPSRVDWWLAILLVLPFVGSASALASGIAVGDGLTTAIGAIALGGYLLLVVGIIWPMRYEIAPDGLHVRAGRWNRLFVPWDRLLGAARSSSPLSSPALSLRRIDVAYRKPNGRESSVLISPVDRDAFLADLAAASPRHQLVDGRLVAR